MLRSPSSASVAISALLNPSSGKNPRLSGTRLELKRKTIRRVSMMALIVMLLKATRLEPTSVGLILGRSGISDWSVLMGM